MLLAILGEEGDAGTDRVAGAANAHLLAVHIDAAAVDRVGAEDGAHQLGAAGAHEPGDPEHLAGVGR